MPSETTGGATQGRLVFVGGVHGVGKGTFCGRVCHRLGWQHISAGKLIAAARPEVSSADKEVSDVDSNQSLLLQALTRVLVPHTSYLLDGHFCLLTGVTTFTETPFEVFRSISPTAILVLHDSPAAILARLLLRDGVQHDERRFRELQEKEIALAKHVALRLRIPFCDATPDTEVESICAFVTAQSLPFLRDTT